MKKFNILLTSIFIISACSQSDNQNQAETSDAPPSLIEYVWHKAGSDFSEDNLSMLINSWNGMIDDAMCSGMMGANILTPEVANEGYDFIWVLLWDSQNSRDVCWDDWTTNLQSNWDSMIEGIMQYDLDNVYLFGWTIGQYPKIENTNGSFVNRFNFCNYNEGYSEADLDTFRDDVAATNWSDSYWYGLLDPKFEPADPAPDFVWLDLWANSAEKEIAQNKYNNSDLPSTTGAAFTCNNVDFAGVAIRR